MRNLPIDPARIRILAAGQPTPATNLDGSPRLGRDGRPLANLPVLVLSEGSRPESATVRLPGPVPAFPDLTPIRLVGLTAFFWKLDNGKSGISLTALEAQPDTARPAATPVAR